MKGIVNESGSDFGGIPTVNSSPGNLIQSVQ
jgi:hypothetical protein